MFEGNISLERMNNCFNKVDALLGVGNRRIKYLALSYFTELIVLIRNIIDILLNSLQLLGSYR